MGAGAVGVMGGVSVEVSWVMGGSGVWAQEAQRRVARNSAVKRGGVMGWGSIALGNL